MGTSETREDPARIHELLVAQADSCELHLAAVQAAYDSGCRRFLEVAYKPQPVTWLNDQLVDDSGALLAGVQGLAVSTEQLA